MRDLELPLAYILDLIIGDPRWFPYPVKLIGGEIKLLERILRRMPWERFAGILLTLIVVSTSYLISYFLSHRFGSPAEVFLFFTALCTKSLGREPMKVVKAIEKEDIERARRELSYLVSRDTEELDERGILRACIETISENTVDGIISPMFYASLGGAPLAMAFKAVSTLDSMVGYKNERYMRFGWASARLDDVANFIPARLSALIISISSLFIGVNPLTCLKIVLRDGRKHESPNSGIPEAAFAGALKVRLGGPNSYFGELVVKPYIGDEIDPLSGR